MRMPFGFQLQLYAEAATHALLNLRPVDVRRVWTFSVGGVVVADTAHLARDILHFGIGLAVQSVQGARLQQIQVAFGLAVLTLERDGAIAVLGALRWRFEIY